MVKYLLFALSLLGLFLFISKRIESYSLQVQKLEEQEMGYIENVQIKTYGNKGLEWTIEGEKLYLVQDILVFDKASLYSQDFVIKTQRAVLDRLSGQGTLIGEVEYHSKDTLMRTENAHIDLKEGKVWGDGEITIVEEGRTIKGRGYTINFRPLSVDLKKAEVRLE
ncbi:LPS export ABC transporter periplasmic protein LptC [Thermocrinis minervae]|uniref:Lipopolysaccharide-assembly, LptC-related n=1 Tax=Thermocrinis minervae TaxID=381751 RepID=A0A1M6T3J1_9AQUI|nr:LPS export ABC transporter periplasmic protein LptC [Thermocrinis minervae]SHK51456.1 Lipopolysaccharide-assembly, LptC-related [Thermocrinis minervae]